MMVGGKQQLKQMSVACRRRADARPAQAPPRFSLRTNDRRNVPIDRGPMRTAASPSSKPLFSASSALDYREYNPRMDGSIASLCRCRSNTTVPSHITQEKMAKHASLTTVLRTDLNVLKLMCRPSLLLPDSVYHSVGCLLRHLYLTRREIHYISRSPRGVI